MNERHNRILVARQLHAMHYPLLDFGPYAEEDGSFFLGLQRLQVGKEPDIERGIPVTQGHWLGRNANPPTSHHVDLGLKTGVCNIPVQLCLATSVTFWRMNFTVSDLLGNRSLETMLHYRNVDGDFADDLEFIRVDDDNPDFELHLGDLLTFENHRYIFLVVKTTDRIVEDFDHRRSFRTPVETIAIPSPNIPSSPSPAQKQSKVPPKPERIPSRPSRVSPRTPKLPPAAQVPPPAPEPTFRRRSPRQPPAGEDTKPPAKPTLPPAVENRSDPPAAPNRKAKKDPPGRTDRKPKPAAATKPSPKRKAKLPLVTPEKKEMKKQKADVEDSDATVPMQDDDSNFK